MTVVVGVALAGPASADPSPAVADAIAAARTGAPCAALRYDPTVEHAADIVNRSTYTYLNHTAENIPADGLHPTSILHDLGIDTGKALALQGAARNGADAVKGVLLQGRNAIPDCAYTAFGVSVLREEQSGFTLAVVVLAAV